MSPGSHQGPDYLKVILVEQTAGGLCLPQMKMTAQLPSRPASDSILGSFMGIAGLYS